MIDDYEKTMALVEKITLHLPIPVRVTKALRHIMRDKGVRLPGNKVVFIEKVFYMGDEGGIGCGLKYSTSTDTAFVVSLTHLRIKNSHPLAEEIRDYQFERTKRLQRAAKAANQDDGLGRFLKR